MQDALVVKICRYLRAAAMRHTAVVRAFRAHSANNTFCKNKRKDYTGNYKKYCLFLINGGLKGMSILNINKQDSTG